MQAGSSLRTPRQYEKKVSGPAMLSWPGGRCGSLAETAKSCALVSRRPNSRGIRRKVGSTGGPLTRSGEELWNRMQQAMKRGVLRDRGRDRAGTGREVWKAANYRKDSDSAGVKSGGMVGVGWPGESAPAGVLNVLISDDPGKLTCVPVGTTRMEPGR
ncbi:hypothetical protein EDB85DRAFT_1892290 [Lactarius pseudohatsudake]|nr:hypothetical protein EDB85DRAFT_1892290 [Lactarius pseudohatsudake]